jgi:trimethylamine--corrinoid protein Co-methyltransferase
VLDDALCGTALRLARGIEVNEETLALDLIQEVGWQGHYLAQPHTAKHHRAEFYRSKLLRRDTRETWEKKGSKTALDLASERVREILATHQPRQLDPAVEQELQDYLSAVRKRGVADFEAAEWED